MSAPGSTLQHDEADPVAVLAIEDLNIRANTRMELESQNSALALPVSNVGESSVGPTVNVGSPERSNTISYLRALSPDLSRPAASIVASEPAAPMVAQARARI